MERFCRTWAFHGTAVRMAHLLAKVTRERQRVIREDGTDVSGEYHWRIVPADVGEPCS